MNAMLTICVHQAIGEEEWQCSEQEPQAQLQEVIAMVQVLVTLVALVLHTKHRQAHGDEEKLQNSIIIQFQLP